MGECERKDGVHADKSEGFRSERKVCENRGKTRTNQEEGEKCTQRERFKGERKLRASGAKAEEIKRGVY